MEQKKAGRTGRTGKKEIVLESFAKEDVKEKDVMDMLEEVEFEENMELPEEEVPEEKKEKAPRKAKEEKVPKEKAPRKAKEEKVPKEKAPRKAKEEKVPKEKAPRKAKEEVKREKLPRKAKEEVKEEVKEQYVLIETEECTMIEDARTKSRYFLRENKCFTEDRLVGKWCDDHIEFHNLKSDEVKKMTFKNVEVNGDKLGQRTGYIDGNCIVYLNSSGDIWGTYCPKKNMIEEFIEEGDNQSTQEADTQVTQEADTQVTQEAIQIEDDADNEVTQETDNQDKTQLEEEYI